ncbi:MAG: MMPL family transporter [Planctomycetaceae bacterium]
MSLTGIPVLESDEMRRSQSDMTIASVISFLGVGVLLFIGFRGFRHPLLAMLMLLVGIAWSLGYATLFVGHLNILSVSFSAILVGLGIDFAIHYLAKYLELRHKGIELRPALLRTSWGVGTGIVTAAVTTALAFFCATFTSFLGVAELGIIAGGAFCCVASQRSSCSR